ncbi:Tyrosine-protein phosphatase non-receptor type 23 [Trichinella nelsoni]|uniref:Tyrosine-protein phosphatase non-receptor type 23 n=1 Tax=Trichinella nelsoni TaxID=6336 RepID=A0A0V0RVR8_9BILA|nr:Tyrosine-protein phosphatase non-receptor type 23 [Trichinella nelsoni]
MELNIEQSIHSRLKLMEIRPRSFPDDYQPLFRVPFAAIRARICKNSNRTTANMKTLISSSFQADFDKHIESLLISDTCDAGTSIVVQSTLREIRQSAGYYIRLMFLKDKLNSISEKERPNLLFSWIDSFRNSPSPAINQIDFEMASVLHNIASSYSFLAARLNRATSMDMHLAATFFQFASGMLEQLRGKHSEMARYNNDFSTPVISFRYKFMLAQAQECMVERSMLDGIDEKYISEFVMQAIQDYNACDTSLDEVQTVEAFPANEVTILRQLIDFKRTYFTALLHMSLSNVAFKEGRRDEVIARLRLAKEGLNGIESKFAQLPEQFLLVTERLLRVVDRKLSSTRYYGISEKEIARVELNPCMAVLAVGPMSLFEQEQTTEINTNNSTMYVQRVASVFRNIRAVALQPYLTHHDELNRQFKSLLRSTQLEQVYMYVDRKVPDDIAYWSNLLKANPQLVDRLNGILNHLHSVRMSARTKLIDVVKRLKDFRGNIKKHQRKSTFKVVINYFNGTEKMVAKCQGVFRQAEETGDQLSNAHKSVMLVLETLQKSLDCVAETIFADLYDPCSTEVGSEMNELRTTAFSIFFKRMSVIRGLHKSMENEDPVEKLNMLDEIEFHGRFFDEELAKYDDVCQFLRSSFETHEKIFKQISSLERNFKSTREHALRCNESITRRFKSMVECCKSIKTMESKVDEGERFYTRLHFLLNESLRRIEQLEIGATCGYKNIKAEDAPCCISITDCLRSDIPLLVDDDVLLGRGFVTMTNTETESGATGDGESTASEHESIAGRWTSDVEMKNTRRGSSFSKSLQQQRQAGEKVCSFEVLKQKLCCKGVERTVALKPKLDLDELKTYLENFKELVDSLETVTSNGMTKLDLEWQEVQRKCNEEGEKHVISEAKKFTPMNRNSTMLPYDDNRILVVTPKQDYVNASLIGKLCEYGPVFYIAQIPTKPAVASFWCMLFENKIELLCMIFDSRDCNAKNFMPRENAKLKTAQFSISVSSKENFGAWTESTIVMEDLRDPNRTHSFKCLHFDGWQDKSELIDVDGFVKFVLQVRRYFLLQKQNRSSVVAMSLYGSSRSGIFSICLSACCEIMAGKPLPPIDEMPERLCVWRNNCITSKRDLYTCYMVVLTLLKNICESQENGDFDEEEETEQNENEQEETEDNNSDESSIEYDSDDDKEFKEELRQLEEKMAEYTFTDPLDLQLGGPSCSGLGNGQQAANENDNGNKPHKCCYNVIDMKNPTKQSMTQLLHLVNAESLAIFTMPCKACRAKCACHSDSSDETVTDE